MAHLFVLLLIYIILFIRQKNTYHNCYDVYTQIKILTFVVTIIAE